MGRSGGSQPLSLGSGCEYVGVVMHELMHSIGEYTTDALALIGL